MNSKWSGRKCGVNETSKGMRVFIDTNVLISALISEKSVSSQFLRLLVEQHQLIICSYTITEVSKVLNRKFPKHTEKWDKFITSLEFELAYTPIDLYTFKSPPIRDPFDLPILISAMITQPDVFVTGDYDFHTEEIREYFAVYTPSEFLHFFGHPY
jgi:putative PIN family toxin of toxin-antitoxin system